MSEITCIMPCRNFASFLPEALDSIANQTYPITEIIFVDDGSTDNSLEVALAADIPNLRVITQETKGPSAARDTGVAASKTEFVMFFDADDIAPLDRTVALMGPLQSDTTLDAVFGHWENFWDEEVEFEKASEAATPHKGRQTDHLVTSAIFRSTSFEKFGTFCDHTYHKNDFANHHVQWLFHAKSSGLRSASVDDLVLRRRIHRNNLSRKQTKTDLLEMIASIRNKRKGKTE